MKIEIFLDEEAKFVPILFNSSFELSLSGKKLCYELKLLSSNRRRQISFSGPGSVPPATPESFTSEVGPFSPGVTSVQSPPPPKKHLGVAIVTPQHHVPSESATTTIPVITNNLNATGITTSGSGMTFQTFSHASQGTASQNVNGPQLVSNTLPPQFHQEFHQMNIVPNGMAQHAQQQQHLQQQHMAMNVSFGPSPDFPAPPDPFSEGMSSGGDNSGSGMSTLQHPEYENLFSGVINLPDTALLDSINPRTL